MDMIFIVFFFVTDIERKTIWKIVNYSTSRENSEWRGEKDGKLLLNLLAMSTKWPLMSDCCQLMRELREMTLWVEGVLSFESIRECTRWLGGSLYACNCDLPPSFWRWSLIRASPAMALILYGREVLKASKIHITALLCIFPRAFKWYVIGAWL